MDGVESGRGVVRLPLWPILTLIFLEEGEGGGGAFDARDKFK